MAIQILVHIVTFNSAAEVGPCLSALATQVGVERGLDYNIEITDNASTDDTEYLIEDKFSHVGRLFKMPINMGFCSAHNAAAARFLRSEATHLLVLNPDVVLPSHSLKALKQKLEAIERAGERTIGAVVPKLLRADAHLQPVKPQTVDSCGITFHVSWRHFDRGAGVIDEGQFDNAEFVAGGTGACLCLSREFVTDVALRDVPNDEDLGRVYPWALEGKHLRVELFDEAFFAYREDADLALRAARLGWRFWYEPSWIGYHRRLVTPERRQSLSPFVNSLGVRNRFLLQLNNFSLQDGWRQILWGLVVRNVVVVAGVFLRERSSLRALWEVVLLARRAWRRRRVVMMRGVHREALPQGIQWE